MTKAGKKAGGVTVLGVIVVGAILGSKWLGGPDLTALLKSDSGTTTAPHQPAGAASEQTARRIQPTMQAEPASTETVEADETAIRALIDSQTSGEMVELHAEIVKLLPNDNEGSRHQRILLALQTGGTMLVAHNIDLAERIPADEGDWITVYGQYEWNDRGGVLHWTHHDPKQWREGGWIEHAGVRYE
ncbi:MAG: DUF3465 domain-containing protein [Planctomycetota bacterium]